MILSSIFRFTAKSAYVSFFGFCLYIRYQYEQSMSEFSYIFYIECVGFLFAFISLFLNKFYAIFITFIISIGLLCHAVYYQLTFVQQSHSQYNEMILEDFLRVTSFGFFDSKERPEYIASIKRLYGLYQFIILGMGKMIMTSFYIIANIIFLSCEDNKTTKKKMKKE